MKFIQKVGDLTIEIEAKDLKDYIAQTANMNEVVAAARKCGLCDGESVRFNMREHDGNAYYELVCNDCGAILSLGQRKDGGLFVKRETKDKKRELKDGKGKRFFYKGWHYWKNRFPLPSLSSRFLSVDGAILHLLRCE